MNDELYHHGVKGMKWGVRKDRLSPTRRKAKNSLKNANTQQRSINRQKNPTHKELTKSTNAKQIYKNRNRLTDKELQNRINRINKEIQLKELSSKQQSAGRKWIQKILIGAGTAIAAKYTVKGIEKLIKKGGSIVFHMDNNIDELYHHGVKGMKWGVRKDPKYIRKKAELKSLRKQFRETRRSITYDDRISPGAKKRKKLIKLNTKIAVKKAEMAKLKKGKKGELQSYARSRNSNSDIRRFGRSVVGYPELDNNLDNYLISKKGKAYVKKVKKRTTYELVKDLATLTALATGYAVITGILVSKI